MLRGKILIVDDERPTRVALQGLFISRSWEVVVAESQADGLSYLADYEPDWVIVSWGMLTGTGESFIRGARAGSNGALVALVTEETGAAEAALVKRLRADAVFQKPLTLDVIYRTCESRGAGRKAAV